MTVVVLGGGGLLLLMQPASSDDATIRSRNGFMGTASMNGIQLR
jgi:hypothetical protein